jgi:hypothetical protein
MVMKITWHKVTFQTDVCWVETLDTQLGLGGGRTLCSHAMKL